MAYGVSPRVNRAKISRTIAASSGLTFIPLIRVPVYPYGRGPSLGALSLGHRHPFY